MVTSILPWEREKVACADDELLAIGRDVIRNEAEELLRAVNGPCEGLVAAARAIFECRGRVVVVGMGKSGHIGCKIAATLASLGTPALFLHAAEALHGDLGTVRSEDVGVFLSNSGSTDEILALLPWFRQLGARMIAITGSPTSPLAQNSDIVIDSGVTREADPLQLAPTSSATLQMVLGDALAGMVTRLRGLRREDFAAFHPGGALGRRLLTTVADVMGSPDQLPLVHRDVSVMDALFEITSKKYGSTCVVDDAGRLAGFFTDGDLRRLLEKNGVEAMYRRIDDFMTRTPQTITADRLAMEAMRIMEQRKISALVVVGAEGEGKQIPVGIVHFHELLKAGLT
ncbi:MAG: KpsF/GutQ family sugar-phosphate isomerase [Synergistaceae bacterium]|jgi:arabinose-5-phosphate isomerase|nr:KpsF/GutQ family sugar-phosphate isomerase [Synergistaceae bacterium]